MIGFMVYIFILAEILFAYPVESFSDRSPLKDSGTIEIRGIYGSPDPFWNRNISLNQLNVNAIFLNWHYINPELMERVKEE